MLFLEEEAAGRAVGNTLVTRGHHVAGQGARPRQCRAHGPVSAAPGPHPSPGLCRAAPLRRSSTSPEEQRQSSALSTYSH